MPYYYKERKIEELIRQLAAQFLQRESNGLSLVTVTAVTLSDKITTSDRALERFSQETRKNKPLTLPVEKGQNSGSM